MEFPSDYPSGCLLGYVDVIDCLSQEQFQEQVSTEMNLSMFALTSVFKVVELALEKTLSGKFRLY